MNWLKEYIDYKGISVLSFEKSIGTRSTIDKAIKNNSNLRSDILAKIIETYTDISPEWLLTGKGKMLNSNSKSKSNLNDFAIEEIVTYLFNNKSEFRKSTVYQLLMENELKEKVIEKLKEEKQKLVKNKKQINKEV